MSESMTTTDRITQIIAFTIVPSSKTEYLGPFETCEFGSMNRLASGRATPRLKKAAIIPSTAPSKANMVPQPVGLIVVTAELT